MDGPGGSAAPPGGGARPCPLPAAGRRRRGPASLHLLTPEAASLRAAASRASRSLLRIFLLSPPPTPALTPLFCTPSPFPAAARRSADTESAAGFAEPSGGPGRSIAAPGGGAGPARGASGAVAARTVPLRVPPRPRAARVLPGTPWSRRVPSGHKGARGTMGAASPWAPGARSGDSALRGGGRPSRRALSGQPPYASPPVLPPPTPAWMLQPLARPSAPEPPPPRGRLEPPRTYLGHEFCTLQSGPAPSWGATWGVGGARGWGVGAARGGPGRGGPGSCWGQRAGAVYFPLSLCVSVRCALA